MKNLSETGELRQSFLWVTVFLYVLIFYSANALAVVTEFVPSVYVSEDYTDNYDQTEFDKVEEFYTTYGIGLSLGFLQKNGKVLLNYNPEFKDYDKHDEEDAWEHNSSLTGDFQPSRRSSINFSLNYDGHGGNNESESWEHGAFIGGSYEISKYTGVLLSADYSNTYDRQQRTGDWNESEDYSFSGGINHRFGKNDSVAFDYTYSMTDYKEPDSDDYEEHNPSIFLAYWFAPQLGFDSNLSYEQTVYDLSGDDSETWAGDIRLIRKITKFLDVYGKYEHSFTKEDAGDHTVYNPSAGFDWSATEDSRVSLGLGYMIQEWENGERTEGFFLDADVFKTIDFSRRGSFTMSASSGYDATSEDAASLGFQIYYQAGFLLSYQLLRNLSSRLTGSFTRDEFDDPEVNRVDNTLECGAGLSWAPWKWMIVDLNYTFEDFTSDDETMEEYRENTATIKVTLYPARPPRMISGSSGERVDIENKIYNTSDEYIHGR